MFKSFKSYRKLMRVTIVGYGNIGRGVHNALGKSPDMELAGIITRRPAELQL